MISFIFSLTLIDRRQRRWRLSQHRSPDTTAGWSRAWLDPDPEPYQASPSPRKENERSAAAEKGGADAYSGWYTRKKKRAIARMEISDAFEMRKRVVVALLVWSGLVIWAAYYLLKTLYSWATGT
ncbi:MAG: hypothetical protein INR62_06985 [Rhodospirillales bacterium]|nr:hypothetical protein [Acetobacter sp.]